MTESTNRRCSCGREYEPEVDRTKEVNTRRGRVAAEGHEHHAIQGEPLVVGVDEGCVVRVAHAVERPQGRVPLELEDAHHDASQLKSWSPSQSVVNKGSALDPRLQRAFSILDPACGVLSDNALRVR